MQKGVKEVKHFVHWQTQKCVIWRDEKQHQMNLTSDLPSSGETVSSLKVFAKKQTNKWHLKWKLRACGYKAFVIYLVFKGLSCEDASSERVSGWVTRNAHVKNRWSCRKSQQSRLEMCKIIIHPLTHHFWHFQQTRFWKTTNQEFGSFWKISTFEVVQPTPDIPPTVVEEQKCKFAVAFADFCFYSVQCVFSFDRTEQMIHNPSSSLSSLQSAKNLLEKQNNLAVSLI